MKIAYLILGHTDPEQLKNLLLALEYPNFDFYIHIDKKQDINIFKSYIDEKDNLIFLDEEKRINIYWAGFNMVQATINLLTEASKNKKYDRFVILSGLDYPIKSPKYIREFFKKNHDVEFVDAFNITGYEEHKTKKIWFFDLPIKNDKIRTFIRRILAQIISKNPLINSSKKLQVNGREIPVYFSAQWIALTGGCVNHLLEVIDDNPQLIKYFKNTYAPDELFFATLVANSHFKKNMINCQEEKFAYRAPLHVIEYKEKVKTYTKKDFDELINSSKLFCRKFQSEESSELIEMLVKKNG